jgi:hypothetical protein
MISGVLLEIDPKNDHSGIAPANAGKGNPTTGM